MCTGTTRKIPVNRAITGLIQLRNEPVKKILEISASTYEKISALWRLHFKPLFHTGFEPAGFINVKSITLIYNRIYFLFSFGGLNFQLVFI